MNNIYREYTNDLIIICCMVVIIRMFLMMGCCLDSQYSLGELMEFAGGILTFAAAIIAWNQFSIKNNKKKDKKL